MVAASSPVWETRNLREVVTKLVDGSHNPPPKQEAGLPMLSARNIDRGQILFDDFRFISEEAYATENARTRIAAGDVLLTIVGTIGRTAVVPAGSRPFSLQRSVAVLTPAEIILPKFLCYQLQSPEIQKHFETNARGTAQKGVYLKTLGQTPIVLPPVDVQAVVVAEIEKQFSRLDEAVANLLRVKANLKRHRNSVLQSVTAGKGADESTSADTSVWRWLTVEELASKEPRSIQSGPFGSNLKHSEFQPTGKLVIGIDNVQDGRFSVGSNHRISESKFEELAKYAARPRDVLITVMATVGRVCVVPIDIEDAIITKHVYRITVDQDVVIPEYVGIALRGSKEVRAQLMDSVQGQTRPGLNGGLIKKIRVPVPPLSDQQRVVADVERQLSIILAADAQVERNLARSVRMRQSVLARAFGQEFCQDERVADAIGSQKMVNRKLPSLPAARKSEAEDFRLDLTAVLKLHRGGMSAEQLFQEAGYRGDQVDAFYRDLALVSSQLVQVLPDVDGENWPASGAVMIQLKA